MMGILSVLAVIFLSQSAVAKTSPPGDEMVVVRFSNLTKDITETFLSPNYDVAAYRPGEYLEIVITRSEYQKLRIQGIDAKITQTESQIRKNLKKRTRDSIEGYRDYEQLLAELQQIEADYPDICKLYDIGDSWGKIYAEEGNSNYDDFRHDIWALKISDNVAVEEDEPAVYYMGEHHAREPISMEVNMAILYHILENYKSDATISKRVNDTQIWFVPLVNPNGHKIVMEDIENMWRKNIRDNNGNEQFDDADNAGFGPDGVDPNRNYGFGWSLIGSSDDPNDSTYHGPEPFSEPEIYAVKNFLDSHHFLAGITYHTHGELVLYPYSNSDRAIAPDIEAMEELGVQMAEAIPGFVDEDGTTEHPHGHYDPAMSWGLYPTAGDHNDYAYGVNGSFSYTIEMAREFIPPAEAVPGICQDNIDGAMILLNRPWRSMVTGLVTDAKTGEPVEAEIIVHGIDDFMQGMDDRFPNAPDFRHPYKSCKDFGRYYRMLTDGAYDVTFWAPGYQSVTYEDVQITSDGQTSLNVRMDRGACPVNLVSKDNILPGMAGGSVFIPLDGTDVASWSITYNGKTENASGYKVAQRVEGLVEGVNQVYVTAKGFDANGNPCEDARVYPLTILPAACPTNSVNGDVVPEAMLGGSVIIPLEGSNADTWEVTYDYMTAVLPGMQTSYELTRLVGGSADITVTAKGFDADGAVCEESVDFSLKFAAPTYAEPMLSPAGPYNPGDTISVQIQTTNALSVTLSDGVSIDGVEMTPANTPMEPDFNNIWSFYNNTWTYEYTAFLPATLTATIADPNGGTINYEWDVDVDTEIRTVFGTVTDANTGWPLYAQVVYGLGTTWTDPVTGTYSVKMPDQNYDFTVTAWLDGYEVETRTVAAGVTREDFTLTNDSSCYAPGYTVNALFHESFDACTLPDGWSVKDNTGNEAVWLFDDPMGRGNLTGGSGCFAISDSDRAGEMDIDTELISPPIDCSELTNVALAFKYDFYTFTGADAADADISTDGGQTWTNIWHEVGNPNEVREPQTAVIDISEQAAGQSDVRIRFRHYDAFWEWFFQVDDVKVYDPALPPCTAPATGGLVVANVSDTDTGDFISISAVGDDQGNGAAAMTTPDDADVDDGFCYFYASSGSLSLTAGSDGYVSEEKTVSVPELGVAEADFQLTAIPLYEMLDVSGLTWITSGDMNWFGQYDITSDDIDAAQSGEITHSEASEISATVQGPGRISFSWKVSSEADWDFLSFYIGDQLISQISGETDWEQASEEIPAGEQVLTWRYWKDTNTDGGVDTGWLDQVSFDPSIPITPETIATGGVVTLTWSAVSASGVQGYNIYRDGEKVSDVPLTGTSFSDTEASLWESHCYAVAAVYSSGESDLSAEVCDMPHGSVLYVDALAIGANNGSSWFSAFTELQSALAIAIPGDEIWVAAGDYTPDYDPEPGEHTGNPEATFQLRSGVAIYGGFDGTETSRDERDTELNETILSGALETEGGELAFSYHVVTASNTDSTAILDGFTIADGDASGETTLSNVMFIDNMAWDGAGMYNVNSSPMLINVAFVFNWADDMGGGLCNFDAGSPTLIQTTFAENMAADGAGIANADNSNPLVVNSILWGNMADTESSSQIYDAPKSSEIRDDSISAITYSIVEGGWDGEGNLDADPMFADASIGDLRLQADSPATDAGDDSALPADMSDIDGDGDADETFPVDFAGYPRIMGDAVDMGAFEAMPVVRHGADYNPPDNAISLSEFLRVIQFYAVGAYHCDPDGEDGYAPGEGDQTCAPHASDYNPQNWQIEFSELLRLLQLYNSSGYESDPWSEDGFVPTD